MVDAINGIEPKKIDWYKLTLREVQQYQSEGITEDMPSEIKRWVEEMAKVANAPDNVTYEMSQSGAETTLNPDETNVNGDKSSGSRGLDEALALGEQSDLAADEVESLMSEIEDWSANAAEAYSQAQNEYSTAMGKINALMRERAGAVQNGDNSKIASLNEELASAGKAAQGTIGGYSAQIDTMQGNISAFSTSAMNAISIGEQTTEVANAELANVDAPDVSKVKNIIAQGTNAINVGSSGLEASSGVDANIGSFGQIVRSYMSDVSEAGGLGENTGNKAEDQDNKIDDAKESDKKPTENVTENKTDDKKDDDKKEDEIKDPALSDKDITTDILEIIKRKERRGEV
ncbi:hypothetical protein J6E39_06660 [bacterium]|nr:hypothetical protein [bacterium]